MTKSVLGNKSDKESELFNREDWASSYCNVKKELQEVSINPIKGSIPQELSGTLYRNGPARLERNGQWVHHPFDGDGMISSFKFNNGKVIFKNRFVKTKAWQEEEKLGRFIYRGVFGTQRQGGPWANAFDLRLKNIANTHVIKLGTELLALWEAAGPHSLDPETLETNGISTLGGVLKSKEPFSAHPKFDPGHNGTARMVSFGVRAGPTSTIRLMEFSLDGQLLNERKEK